MAQFFSFYGKIMHGKIHRNLMRRGQILKLGPDTHFRYHNGNELYNLFKGKSFDSSFTDIFLELP